MKCVRRLRGDAGALALLPARATLREMPKARVRPHALTSGTYALASGRVSSPRDGDEAFSRLSKVSFALSSASVLLPLLGLLPLLLLAPAGATVGLASILTEKKGGEDKLLAISGVVLGLFGTAALSYMLFVLAGIRGD